MANALRRFAGLPVTKSESGVPGATAQPHQINAAAG
jgi:hypothetical protein